MSTRFRWLLRLLPPSFREDHERELLRIWREEARERPDQTRALWRAALFDTLRVAPREHAAAFGRNLTVAGRRLRRSPAFTLTVIFTLALGTGATAAVFSLVDAVLLRPLPWRSPETVGVIWAVQPSGERTWLSYPELETLQREPGAWTSVSGLFDLRPTYVLGGVGQELQALAVSHGLFDMLGVQPTLGRSFTPDDDRDGAARVAMIGETFWRAQLGADPQAIGRTLELDGRQYAVVGVLPAAFTLLPASSVLPTRVDVWLPLHPHLPSRDRSVRFLHALARVPAGVSFTDADRELRAYGARMAAGFPAVYTGGTWTLTIVSFTADVLHSARTALSLLFGLVLLVLLMACANVANLLLARGEARRSELAVRTALGAGPARLAGELLAEALLLAAAGTALGLSFAVIVPAILRTIEPGALPRLADAGLDTRVGLFMLGLMLVTVALFTAVPLVERLRLGTVSGLMAGRSGGRTPRATRLARVLVVAQTALATTIVVSTLFLTDTFVRLAQIDLGFQPEHVLSARVTLSPKYPAGPASAQFFDAVLTAIREAPGVTGAAAVTQLPLSGAMLGSSFVLDGHPDARRLDADLRGVTPDYFDVMQTPLLAGRPFSDRDDGDHPGVVIVDETFARRMDAGGNVVGRRVRWFRQPDRELEIVGVVSPVRHRGPDQPARETVYRSYRQYTRSAMFLVVRTSSDAAAMAEPLRAAVALVDPSQPLAEVMTMPERAAGAIARTRASLLLAAALAVLALSLGAVGLYGVLSVGVAQRRREFGVRLALGATSRSVGALVMREGLLLTSAGALLGAAGAAIAVTLVRTALYDADLASPRLYAAGVSGVLLCSAIAFFIPARRAGRADPMAALRAE